jgi:hypothetical protein
MSNQIIVKQKTAAPPISENRELESWIGNKVGTALQQTYPRLRWGVYVDIPNQLVIIVCPFISATKGYHLHLQRYTIAQLQKRAVDVAGEILERHGISRRQTVNLEHHEGDCRDLRDNIITADSKAEPLSKTCH